MAFNIYISHSLAHNELGIILGLLQHSSLGQAEPFIPHRGWKPGNIPQQYIRAIENAGCVLAIVTRRGHHASHVNVETRLANPEKLIMLAEPNVALTKPYNVVSLDRHDVYRSMSDLGHCAEGLRIKKKQKETRPFSFLAFLQCR